MSRRVPSLANLLAVTFLASWAYVALEWLFFATKPSFMHSFSKVGWFGSLVIPPLAMTLLAVPLLWLLSRIDRVLPAGATRFVVPGFVFAALVFLLIDNFTYTIFRVGIVTSGPVFRTLYALVFLGLLVAGYRWSRSLETYLAGLRSKSPAKLVVMALGVLSVAAVALQAVATDFDNARVEVRAQGSDGPRPNILFLTSDGIESRAMSLYGFSLPTTPFLESFAERALVFENAFPNGGKTTGSLSSMLSGLLPSELHVGFPPHIFPKEHALHHLPVMLRQLGYRGYQNSVRYYADAGDLNMTSSFDIANGRELWSPKPGSFSGRLHYLFNEEAQFSTRAGSRIAARLLHSFWIRPIVNHYLVVKQGSRLGRETDIRTMNEAFDFIRAQEGPYFAQIHLMGTHCCTYPGIQKTFDKSVFKEHVPREARGNLLPYVNSIRDADRHFEWFVAELERDGRLDDTIVIIGSDHSQRWDPTIRIPLMVRFPDDRPAGRVHRNAALAQLAPTLLDYMQVEQPEWMTGTSLLAEPQPRTPLEAELTVAGSPPILSLAKFDYSRFTMVPGSKLSRIDRPGPPLYGVSEIGLVLGPYWKKLNIRSGKLKSGVIAGHSAAASEPPMPSDSAVREYIVRHLDETGFGLPKRAAVLTGEGAPQDD